MDDLGVVEASDNLEDGIDRTDVRQESVSESSTGRGTTGQTSDIIDGQVGGDLRFRLLVDIPSARVTLEEERVCRGGRKTGTLVRMWLVLRSVKGRGEGPGGENFI